MNWVFQTLVTGQSAVEQVYKESKLKGIKICRSNFWTCLRNSVYCGKVPIKAYKKDPDRHVHGLHQPIIFESMFYDVQDYLDGKKKGYGTKFETPDISD